MKKTILGLFAVTTTTLLLSFTTFESDLVPVSVPKETIREANSPLFDVNYFLFAKTRYVYYNGWGSETDASNYTPLSSAPSTQPPGWPGTEFIYWIRISDTDHDYDVDVDDFNVTVAIYNQTNPSGNLLRDESEIPGSIEKGGFSTDPPGSLR